MTRNAGRARGNGTSGAGSHAWAVRAAVLGHNMRSLRLGRMTLEELASLSGVSMGMLSRIENGKGNPSYLTVSRIADALQVSPGRLLSTEPVHPLRVVRASSRVSIRRHDEPSSREVIVPSLTGPMMVYLQELPVSSGTGPASEDVHGEKFVQVLAGEVKVSIEDEEYLLGEDDTIIFDSGRSHSIRNAGHRTVRLLVVTAAAGHD